MHRLYNDITQLIELNRFIEEPRDKYKELPGRETGKSDGSSTAGSDQESGGTAEDPAQREPEEDTSNPLRRGDNSTII
jgi:hypothetical protein